MGIVRWIWHGIVGLFSATLMWFLAVTWPVLLVMLRLLIPIVILVLLLEWLMGGSPSLDIWIEWILVVLIIGTALLLVQPITAPIVRYSLRMAPLPLGESARSSSVLGLALPWLIVFLIFWTAEWPVRAIVVLVGVLGIWKSWEIRRRWKGEPDGEIVLFLRRFDKSADRTIGTAVRQVVPENKQLVFLMGNRPGGASWDPFLVGFDGLHLGWDPKSLPVYLQTTDEEWVERVRGTLQRAKAVIFDATDWSGPMETEASLIEETNAGEKTLVVMRGDRNADAPPIPRKRMIRYRRTWRGTFQRIFWGGVIIVFLPQILMTETQTEEGPNPIATIMLSIVWFGICVRRLMDKDSVEGWLSSALKVNSTHPTRNRWLTIYIKTNIWDANHPPPKPSVHLVQHSFQNNILDFWCRVAASRQKILLRRALGESSPFSWNVEECPGDPRMPGDS